jgi:hypothetical protein
MGLTRARWYRERVFRWSAALVVLAVVIASLAILATLPDRRPALPDATIRLFDVVLTLHPEADPDATWSFAAPEARFDPRLETTVLVGVHDGRRMIGDTIDFTLEGDEVMIDRNDDLIGDRLSAHLVADGWDLDMAARGARQVRIAQREGRFEVPRAEIRGEGLDGVYEDMLISFDFTEFEAGGPGTVGYASFAADRVPPPRSDP